MSAESDFIAALRTIVRDEAARQLLDDAAVMEFGKVRLVITHDMIVEGVHFLSSDPPGDVAWKLLAVNLSDLAAKGASPVGVLLGYTLARGPDWDEEFVRGLGSALDAFGIPLLGGDTVAVPPEAPRSLGLTALGRAAGPVPSRAGACDGDLLWVSGSIGDAGVGLRICRGDLAGPQSLVDRYRRPRPRLELGQRLAPLASAMMDVSDGLLIDAGRMAQASRVGLTIDLRALPLSQSRLDVCGEERPSRIEAATAGDDYELLFAAPHEVAPDILAISETLGIPLTPIGTFGGSAELRLTDGDQAVPLPPTLGFEHRP